MGLKSYFNPSIYRRYFQVYSLSLILYFISGRLYENKKQFHKNTIKFFILHTNFLFLTYTFYMKKNTSVSFQSFFLKSKDFFIRFFQFCQKSVFWIAETLIKTIHILGLTLQKIGTGFYKTLKLILRFIPFFILSISALIIAIGIFFYCIGSLFHFSESPYISTARDTFLKSFIQASPYSPPQAAPLFPPPNPFQKQ